MPDESGLSLRDALRWKRNEITDFKEFIDALCFWQGINEKEAIKQAYELTAYGLPIYDRSQLNTGYTDVPQHLALAAISAKLLNTQPPEIHGESPPAFENLRIIRSEAFKVFARLGVAEPYPWPYPLEWVVGDLINPNSNSEALKNQETNAIAELSPSQTETVLLAMGLMARLLARQSKIYKKPGTQEPNKSQIQAAVMYEAEEMGLKVHGLSTGLRIKIADALKLLEIKKNQSF